MAGWTGLLPLPRRIGVRHIVLRSVSFTLRKKPGSIVRNPPPSWRGSRQCSSRFPDNPCRRGQHAHKRIFAKEMYQPALRPSASSGRQFFQAIHLPPSVLPCRRGGYGPGHLLFGLRPNSPCQPPDRKTRAKEKGTADPYRSTDSPFLFCSRVLPAREGHTHKGHRRPSPTSTGGKRQRSPVRLPLEGEVPRRICAGADEVSNCPPCGRGARQRSPECLPLEGKVPRRICAGADEVSDCSPCSRCQRRYCVRSSASSPSA